MEQMRLDAGENVAAVVKRQIMKIKPYCSTYSTPTTTLACKKWMRDEETGLRL